ncbi:MAG: cell wall-binding repeat-containing protein [Candidatus Methanofastidiosia archaeon]
MHEKTIIVLMLLMLMPSVSSQGRLILVSDNIADSALAEVLSAAMEATVVKISWGMYDEEIIEAILKVAPDRIIIIGGEAAVVKEMEENLNRHGFEVTRVAGKDRVETSVGVYLYFKGYFNQKDAVVVTDMTKRSMERGVRQAISKNFPLFISDPDQLQNFLNRLKRFGFERFTVISSNEQRDLRRICFEKLFELSEKRGKFENRLLEFEVKGVDTDSVREKLGIFDSLLTRAEGYYDEGNYILCLKILERADYILQEIEAEIDELG